MAGENEHTGTTRLQRLGGFLALDPDNPALLHDYADEAWRAGEWQACVVAGERLVALGRARLHAEVLLARALGQLGRHADAQACLKSAEQRHPDQALALAVERAERHLAAHDPEAALESLPPEAAPAAEAPADVAWLQRAAALRVRCLHHLGELDAAWAVAQRDQERHGVRAEVQASALPVLVDLARADEAAELAQTLLKDGADRTPYEVAEPLALQALDREDATVALDWTRWAHARRRDDGRIWLIEGLAQLRQRAPDAAIQALEQAAALMPQHAGSHLALGWTRLLNGQRERARDAFEAALQASPAFAEAHGSMAVLDAIEGHGDAARAGIRRAQGLDRHGASALYAQALLDGRNADDIARLATAVMARARATQAAPRRH